MLMTQQSNIDPIKRFMKSLAQIYTSIIVASPEQKSRLTLAHCCAKIYPNEQ